MITEQKAHTFVNTVFVIAELSANHNQDFARAKKTIKAIQETGADAVKLQTYTPDTITIDCANKYFKIDSGTVWDGRTLYDLYKEAYTPWEWQPELKEYAESLGLLCFSTPFDKTAVDFLETMNVPMYKIASFEITDISLIEYVASKNKPVLISTGIATLADIEEAVNTCKRKNNNDITLLKCTSSYPAPVEEANLLTIPHMKETFKVKVGLSDHTLGDTVALASVALGAQVIEKHIILDRSCGGPDSHFSMEPLEFKKMVEGIRNVEKALGRVTYDLSENVKKSRVFSRSLFVVKDIKKGDIFTEDNIRSIRPGHGLHPKYYNKILGKRALCDLRRGTPLKIDFIVE
ncbi:MAG: pseudaminic acid synthase [bacterium]